jgi:uncharacterized SAM-binding protein YcdF (DUF218 family)
MNGQRGTGTGKTKIGGERNRSHRTLVIVAATVAFILIVSSIFVVWLESDDSSAFRTKLKELLRAELIRENSKNIPKTVDAIYILGGAENSLELKFQTAAELYHKGICKKILIPRRPGITEYSSLLRRNLTNDEWAIRQLEKLDIPKTSIELVDIEKGWFGTLTEAKTISELAVRRRYRNVLLITSPCHTHRVKVSFAKYLRSHNITFYVEGSSERGLLRGLIVEFIKLEVYEHILV